jgi:hypothetical protein
VNPTIPLGPKPPLLSKPVALAVPPLGLGVNTVSVVFILPAYRRLPTLPRETFRPSPPSHIDLLPREFQTLHSRTRIPAPIFADLTGIHILPYSEYKTF